jgi:hypothetical protein
MTRLALVLALAAALQLFGCRSAPDAPAPTYATQTSSGEVSFELTPRMDTSRLVVTVHSDTHSGDLAEIDLAKAFTLEVDGKSLKPVATKPLGGHHSDGFVAFEVGSAPKAFSLTISGVRSSHDVKLAWP